jgi:membrane-bound serine protease (ClpP class)
MTPPEAAERGFVAAIIDAPTGDPYAGLRELYNITAPPTVLADTWSERMVDFLSSAPVIGFMFFAALLCAYVEMHTPGFGVAGSVALLLFALLFGGQYLAGMAAWWEIALFVVGILLILAEIFLIPGFGVAGVLGALFCLGGLVGILASNPPDKPPWDITSLGWEALGDSAFALGLGFVGALVGAGILSRYLPKVPVARKLILAEPAPATGEHIHEASPYARVQPGAVGRVEGTCRPVGRARFGDELVDVVTEGETVEAGAKVRVLYRRGNRLVVDRVEEQEGEA